MLEQRNTVQRMTTRPRTVRSERFPSDGEPSPANRGLPRGDEELNPATPFCRITEVRATTPTAPADTRCGKRAPGPRSPFPAHAPGSGYDYLRIYRGVGTGGAQVIPEATGTGPISFTGTGGQSLTVQLTSDGIINDAGFELYVSYSGVCNFPCAGMPAPGNTTTTNASPCSGMHFTHRFLRGSPSVPSRIRFGEARRETAEEARSKSPMIPIQPTMNIPICGYCGTFHGGVDLHCGSDLMSAPR